MEPVIGKDLVVKVTKMAHGKDGKLYVTVAHPQAENRPTFVWKGGE